jgi:hypothetical protein
MLDVPEDINFMVTAMHLPGFVAVGGAASLTTFKGIIKGEPIYGEKDDAILAFVIGRQMRDILTKHKKAGTNPDTQLMGLLCKAIRRMAFDAHAGCMPCPKPSSKMPK